MTTFVLVHGAWYGPWGWDRVVPLLEEAGARTAVPALTLDAGSGLHAHAREVAAHLAGDGDLVLVGHSYAGLVVREAAGLRPDRVAGIILIDGWAGADGASLTGLAPEWFGDAVRSAATDGLVPAPDPSSFGITDPGDAEWLRDRLRPHPLRAFTETTALDGAVDRIPGTAIHCVPKTFAFEELGKAIGYRTVALDGPHDVMLARPRAVAGLLLEHGFRKEKPED